jgi:hypothetical protein
VGATNRLEGFPEARYGAVAHALVRSVRDLSDDGWGSSISSAWVSYFRWLEPWLRDGAQQAAMKRAAAERAAAEQAAARREAARQAAERAQALLHDPHGGRGAAGDVDLEAVSALLEDEDDEDDDTGYGQIMVSMTNPRRERG